MVEFVDRSVLAQMGSPDMRTPIQYALTYPRRFKGAAAQVDFVRTASLSFRSPDNEKFPCLGMARSAVRAGGTAPAVLCAADEEVVKWYLEGRIKFSDIPKIIEKVLAKNNNKHKTGLTLGSVLGSISWAKEETRSICCH